MDKIKIYRLKCETTGKSYIGQTKFSIEDRFAQHVGKAEWVSPTGRMNRSKLSNAIRKYGKNDFELILIEETTLDKCQERERKFVEMFNSFHNGYNSTKGGDWIPQPPITDETREKMSKNNRWKGIQRFGEENPNFGKKWTVEMKMDMSKKRMGNKNRLGKPHSAESKEKIRISKLGNASKKGKKLSTESKEKIRISKLGKKVEKRQKTYQILTPDDEILIIKGLIDFCNEHGLNKGNITSKSGSKGFRATLLMNN